MRFVHCPDCGALLTHRDLGDEKAVPWCETCDKPWFDMFPVAVISLVYGHDGRVLLLRQNYISTVYRNLVSGYVVPGERAETTAVREIAEETGLDVERLELAGTWWFEKKQMMMIGFLALVRPGELRLSSEVDDAGWVAAEDAPGLVHPHPWSVSQILTQEFLRRKQS